MGLGALIGFDLGFRNMFLISLFVNILLAGAAYGMLFSLFLAVKHKKKFVREYKKISKKRLIINSRKYLAVFLLIILTIILFIGDYSARLFLSLFSIVVVTTFYFWIFIKIVEKACMYKYVNPSQLTEGDWIAKNIKISGKYITGPKDLGIDKKKIRKLIKSHKQKKIKKY